MTNVAVAILPEQNKETVIVRPETQTIELQITDVVSKAQSFTITDDASYFAAVDFGRTIKGFIEEVTNTFKESKSLASKAHKAICAAEKMHLDKFETAIETMRKKVGVYVAEQKRIAAEIAEKKMREAEAEAERLRKIDLEQKENDRINQAAELEKLGFKNEAQSVMEAPIAASAIVPQVTYTPPPVPKAAGTSNRKKYTFEITDAALIERQYLMVDESKIRKMVNALGADFKCAGVKVFEDIQVNFSSKK